MAGSGAGARTPRRGPAPIASFDHDVSDESSPETKQSFRLPEIREDTPSGGGLAPPEQRARSHSTPTLGAGGAPRIDISRASSSSHHDSRDSSPELALFAGDESRAAHLGFREDGALDLRSSTEELAFLEPAPGEPPPAAPRAPPPAPPPAPPAPERRHSRKDSQGSEAALLAVSGRTSRLSSVGSQCSAQSALSGLSRVSRLSVVSGVSRSPSPHRMLLETSFCGPKPIETDPEIGAGVLVERILGIAKTVEPETSAEPAGAAGGAVDARDRREVRTEATVESARAAPLTPAVTVLAPPPPPPVEAPLDRQKEDDENKNYIHPEERKARPRLRREPSEPEVYKSRNRTKDIIRIKLKPDDSYDEEEESEQAGAGAGEGARKPATLELGRAARPAEPEPPSPALSRRRSPSPAGPPVSRKSSFCSLFKSRETIASPESPSEALRRKRSLTEGRSRSKSRDRSATPTSGSKIRGSVLSLFRTPRRSGAATSPGSREGSPCAAARSPAAAPPPDRRRADKLKYYDAAENGIIHIPLRTPPDERPPAPRRNSGADAAGAADAAREPRPASAPQPRPSPDRTAPSSRPPPKPERSPVLPAAAAVRAETISHIETERTDNGRTRPLSSHAPPKPIHRTVLPDGSIIIPLHSPTERSPATAFRDTERDADGSAIVASKAKEEVPLSTSARIENSEPPARSAAAHAAGPAAGAEVAAASTPAPFEPAPTEDSRKRKKERLVFTTHVGSREQVFSTQFSITKTPSITSEISGSFPSFTEGEEARAPLRDTHIAADGAASPAAAAEPPPEPPRDSSESEPSSEAAPSRAGNDVERRGLVVAESFEEELPYVPTTLPQERPVALPMVPVRERGDVRVSGVRRPRAPAPPAAPPRAAPPPAPAAPPSDKLRIKLPRRPRAAPAADAPRPRTRSGSETGGETRSKQEWIDFEEVPERRKQPKRIQTLPAGAGAGGGGALLSYVAPEHCRCECHAAARDDTVPLLPDDAGSPGPAVEARPVPAQSPPP